METTKTLSRSYLIEALFLLLQKKSFSSITVGDICVKAGVSRVTYYRNFDSKEDMIRAFFLETGKQYFHQVHQIRRPSLHEMTKQIFLMLQNEKEKIDVLRRDQLIYIYLEFLNKGFRSIFEDSMSARPEQSYVLAGALFNYSLWWLDEGCKTPVDDVAKMFLDCFRIEKKEDTSNDLR